MPDDTTVVVMHVVGRDADAAKAEVVVAGDVGDGLRPGDPGADGEEDGSDGRHGRAASTRRRANRLC